MEKRATSLPPACPSPRTPLRLSNLVCLAQIDRTKRSAVILFATPAAAKSAHSAPQAVFGNRYGCHPCATVGCSAARGRGLLKLAPSASCPRCPSVLPSLGSLKFFWEARRRGRQARLRMKRVQAAWTKARRRQPGRRCPSPLPYREHRLDRRTAHPRPRPRAQCGSPTRLHPPWEGGHRAPGHWDCPRPLRKVLPPRLPDRRLADPRHDRWCRSEVPRQRRHLRSSSSSSSSKHCAQRWSCKCSKKRSWPKFLKSRLG